MPMYSLKLSKSQAMPWRSASRSMPSTTERLRMTRSRTAGGAGTMPKPQLPITAVVTPSDGEGESVASQVTCAS